MTEQLSRWVEENKLVVSESTLAGSDIIEISGVGKFLYIHPVDGKIIDEDFGFILNDEEFDLVDKKSVDFILFEFGTKFYYSGLKQDKNKYNEIIFKPEFIDFKYLGKSSEPFIMDFVHLGVHDEYEMLNGSGACDLWVKKAKFLGHKAIGVCDFNTLSSSIAFQTYCEKKGLKAIIGETISVARNYSADEEVQETFELKLYALTDQGWKNLLMVSKLINVDYNGFIPDQELYKYGEGLCCVIPKESEMNYIIDDRKATLKLIKKYKQTFDQVYYQIDTVEYVSEQLFKKHLTNIDKYICGYRSKVEPILINDAYYLDEEEHDLKAMLNKVAGKVTPEGKDQYYKSCNQTLSAYDEWLDDTEPLFEVILTGIENTVKMADSVKFRIDNSDRKIPAFEVDDPEEEFFTKLQEGIQEKLIGVIPDKDLPKYMDRIETECQLIVPNDLCSYFLILWDIVHWCREQNIMVGPGRGSVCGSLVAYCLDITQIDPIPYALYFERFLNASRVSAHHAYHLTMEDGSEYTFKEGDLIPLTNGKEIEANKDVDFCKLDVDISKLKK